ncbi:13021_t:CDS:2 [Entrophospora sp. SA101]|nr:9003_t:CDS:2 [Entrophospora sp. SA101]CAJ0873391.1 13021_t:CDS:2 [Entrophospora sp. SA101]
MNKDNESLNPFNDLLTNEQLTGSNVTDSNEDNEELSLPIVAIKEAHEVLKKVLGPG